jgi:Mn-containing catalase
MPMSPLNRSDVCWRRLYNAAHEEGMKDMLSFLITRDTMHQQQWLAAIEELGGNAALPIPNSFDQSQEKQEFSYARAAPTRSRQLVRRRCVCSAR